MKTLLRGIVLLVIGLFFSACGQTITATPSPVLSQTVPSTATLPPIPTSTTTIEPTVQPEFVPPTLIPTIDPSRVPELLRHAFSSQTMEGVNGHKIQRITGWDHGYGAGIWEHSCPGFYWLDTDHLLLYPATGQENGGPEGIWRVNVAPQPVMINLKTGYVWLPSEETSAPSWSCYPVYWSKKLGILIISGTYEGKSAVFTYTLDGERLAYYSGELASISPSKTNILVGENTFIDLQTGKSVSLAWSLEDYHEFMLSGLFWTSDETRIYRCCYFYADLATGISQRFERSDFQDTEGNHLDADGLWFYRGQWVRNDTYFLAEWSMVDDGDIRYLPLFDPAKKLFYDVREEAGISDELTCPATMVSTSGTYVWLNCDNKNYLINLTTFETNQYPGYKTNIDVGWSADDTFAWVQSYEDDANQYYLLSISNKGLKSLPVSPKSDGWQDLWWHPVNDILAYISSDGQKLGLVDAQTLSIQELPLPMTFRESAWSPKGDRIALIAEDGSIWQIDFPTLENLERLTPSLPNVHEVNWSPEGSSIAFISSSDIYIVETTK